MMNPEIENLKTEIKKLREQNDRDRREDRIERQKDREESDYQRKMNWITAGLATYFVGKSLAKATNPVDSVEPSAASDPVAGCCGLVGCVIPGLIFICVLIYKCSAEIIQDIRKDAQVESTVNVESGQKFYKEKSEDDELNKDLK